MTPVTETQAVVRWPSAKINDKGKDDQTDDGDDLDTGETEFSLSVDRYREDVQANDQEDDNGDPSCYVNASSPMPKLNDDRSCGNFGTQRNSRIIPILSWISLIHIVHITLLLVCKPTFQPTAKPIAGST